MAPESPTAFFSYGRVDSEFALKLAADLRAAGANVWIDQLDIVPGAPWDRAVEEALTQSALLLVILSPVSVSSDNVSDEVSFALSNRKRVIPVLFRECKVPFRLARLQHIDFRTDYARGLTALLKTLSTQHGALSEAAIRATPVVSPGPPIGAQNNMARTGVDSDDCERGASVEETTSTPERDRQRAAADSALAMRESQSILEFRRSAFWNWQRVVIALPAILVSIWLLFRWGLPFPNEKRGEAQSHQLVAAKLESLPTPSDVSSVSQPAPMEPPRWILEKAASERSLSELWRKQSAGDSGAMVLIGDAYHKGEIVVRDEMFAFLFYQKAAALNNPDAMQRLEFMYANGFGVRKDPASADSWRRKALDVRYEMLREVAAHLKE